MRQGDTATRNMSSWPCSVSLQFQNNGYCLYLLLTSISPIFLRTMPAMAIPRNIDIGLNCLNQEGRWRVSRTSLRSQVAKTIRGAKSATAISPAENPASKADEYGPNVSSFCIASKSLIFAYKDLTTTSTNIMRAPKQHPMSTITSIVNPTSIQTCEISQ